MTVAIAERTFYVVLSERFGQSGRWHEMQNEQEILRLLGEIEGKVARIRSLVEPQTESPEVLDYTEGEGRVRKAAYLHQVAAEAKGSDLTLDESLEIRRQLYPNIRGSAALFGRADGNSILVRRAPYGSKRKGKDSVKLTKEGIKKAQLYREACGL